VQLEDKIVDGRDAALAESQQREDVDQRGAEAMPAATTEAVHDAGLEQRSRLLGAIRMVLDGQSLALESLHLPQRETLALEALQVAADGKSADLDQFVYAEDRRDLLEQALAVLQPNLTRADELTALELHAQFADLAERVGELRQQLSHLEDAQDELERAPHQPAKAAATDSSDKPVADPDAPRPASTLSSPGPEAPAPAAGPSTLSGPGPEATRAPAPTTLTGPEVPDAIDPPAASTLSDGPDVVAAAPPPSTLGAPEPDDSKASKSWWRKPFA
jgi:hypothetical protein